MADMVTGPMVSLIPKLGQLLMEEYSRQTDVKKRINSLTLELELSQAAIRKVAEVPWDELDEQVKIWAREVRESSYDMEDFLDTFLVRVKSRDSTEQESSLKRLGEQVNNLIHKIKARHKISVGVKDIMEHLDELTKTCWRYKFNDIESRPSTASTLDPRLAAMYNKVKSLIGINESRDELISMLQPQERGDMSNAKMKTVSVVGVGGLGKTTLAKAVYETLRSDYDCKAFVPVGRKPDMNKVIQAILIDLHKERYMKFDFAKLHSTYQFINELRDCLCENKRYFIVIDDIWDTDSWDTLKLAIDDDNNCGGRIIVTTRIREVATKAGQVYNLKPLSYPSSRELFHTRISGDERKHIDYNESDEISDEILKRCGGIPLAIITMASLLAGKPRDAWSEIYKSIGFGCKNNNGEDIVTRILSFSFYDLPPYLRTCLLYFSAYPEDSVIPKDGLVWKWVAEGFVQGKQGKRLFETGEEYLNDLINRSLIEPVEENFFSFHSIVTGYRVHDMVLDFIYSISCRENFFTVIDDDQGTPLRSNVVRRLAYHNKAMGRHTHQVNHFNHMGKVRSFIAQVCVNGSWAPFSSFKLLRVLAIENSYSADVYPNHIPICIRIRIEDLGHLVHLRYLSLINAHVEKIPQEMGALKFLQTLDLRMSDLVEMSSISSLPTQLLCLRIRSDAARDDAKVASVERLTSLEELLIHAYTNTKHFRESCLTRKWAVKDLGSLKELRMLTAWIFWDGEESKTDFLESLHHLHKLQHLEIKSYYQPIKSRKGSYTWNTATWGAAELVLPRHLRHLDVEDIFFSKLPHCINHSCLPILSHLHLELKHMDDQDMRVLGLLPELHYLCLKFSCSFTISNINDSDVVYFPKLVCFILWQSMILFVGNKEEETVSIHVWNGEDDIAMPSHESEDDDELRRSMPSVSDNELHMPSVSDDEQQRPRRQLPDGLLALSYYYLLAFFQHVVAFVKKWSSLKQVGQEAFTSNRGSDHGNEENAIAMASAPTDDENKHSSLCTRGAVVPCHFMPSLRELSFQAHGKAVLGDHRYYDHLGWEYLSSLRKIRVHIISKRYHPDPEVDKVEAVLKRAADMHPKRPALNVSKSWH